MKKILLDTNAYAAFKSGNIDVITILQHADLIGMSVIVLGELTTTFSVGPHYKKNLSELNGFLTSPRVTTLPIDENTISFYTKICTKLAEKHTLIPTNDIWLAATALQHGCRLCSFDEHFQAIDSLVINISIEEFLL